MYGLAFVTSCGLGDTGWGLRATLPSGATDWSPVPGPVSEDLEAAQDRYVTLADVRAIAQWLATRFVRASPTRALSPPWQAGTVCARRTPTRGISDGVSRRLVVVASHDGVLHRSGDEGCDARVARV